LLLNATSLIFLLYKKLKESAKSISLIINTLATTAMWSSGTLCATQTALEPLESLATM